MHECKLSIFAFLGFPSPGWRVIRAQLQCVYRCMYRAMLRIRFLSLAMMNEALLDGVTLIQLSAWNLHTFPVMLCSSSRHDATYYRTVLYASPWWVIHLWCSVTIPSWTVVRRAAPRTVQTHVGHIFKKTSAAFKPTTFILV